ncbi:hypothetical protein [Umezawaea sp. Da 62-37]|uniref:hypothetical protein n=1 Tax=Umezawaea sp. Da 62-37 TaxID=3075927 RepID=UPI0028F71620|nr:hypothetical protein [Umezawaea sp. Da 62-37]WNV90346.1 hypothetical protein RM788_19310 [Umezawaea sp. Da 62-37]
MTRQELAEALNAYVTLRDPKAMPLDFRNIGLFERGVTRWPRKLIREALRSVLMASNDSALGLHTGRRASLIPQTVAAAPSISAEYSSSNAEFCDRSEKTFIVDTAKLDMLMLNKEGVLVVDRRRVWRP